jgi:peptide-methionine (S)-S-oxide reductase
MTLEKATLAGGCFWCLETIFNRLKGVQSAVSGYAGGHVEKPTYQQVCTDTTGHAEVVQVTFDPQEISYETLLEVFFSIHDPTTLNRQGNDVGSQYRSAIFPHSAAQEETARRVMARIAEEGVWDEPVVTRIEKLKTFWPAEDYHQDYYNRNGSQPYCRAVIAPKLSKFKKNFKDLLKAT